MKKLCLSHIKDIDGVSSAALVKAATGCEFELVDYDSIFEALDSIPEDLEELIICDLGTDQSRFGEFFGRISRLSEKMKITYIDHHYISPEDKALLRRLHIKLVHNVNDCAGMLTYLTFKNSLPEQAKMIALYAAVTDYMDDSRNAQRIMERYERHLILYESTLLSYALAKLGADPEYPHMLVERLSRMTIPHQIEGVAEGALAQARVVAALMREVGRQGTMLRSVAYFETTERATGIVAKLLLGAFDVEVGVSLRRKAGGRTEMSLRSTSDCTAHLGRTIGPIAARHGGGGGGHAKAAGCNVPSKEAITVVRELDEAVSAQA